MNYELIVGLETHIELLTKTKIFCSCKSTFGAEPNTNCCPVCIGLPGTLPVLNESVVDLAIKAGLATNCEINSVSKMDRKNYVYPDLPKAYQISQYDMPICSNGYIELFSGKKIRIERIHIEEDAGKLIHKDGNVLIDYNRCGVPLIEVVSSPDISNSNEAKEYIEKLQLIMKYIGVSDCKMQEGSMRCDVNVSVRRKGSTKFGTKTEIKNINSVNFVAKAINFEMNRQINIIESGKEVIQETRRYCEKSNSTEQMRSKEDANDYRYFKEPDLTLINIPKEKIKKLKSELPELPYEKIKRYIQNLNIPEKDAMLLVKYKKIANFFEKSVKGIKSPRVVSNLLISQVFKKFGNDSAKENFDILISPNDLRELCLLFEEKKISMSLLKSTLDKMLETGEKISVFITSEDLKGISEQKIKDLCREAIINNKKAVNDYFNGKEKALKSLVGFVMKETKGKADAVAVTNILNSMLKDKK